MKNNNAEVTFKHNMVGKDPKQIPVITFVFANGEEANVVVGTKIRGMRSNNGERPINIKWKNIPDDYKVSEELERWLMTDLMFVFDHRVDFINKAKDILRLKK